MRAIRGIAGGQWTVKTWVGDKESEYSNVKKAEASTGTQTPSAGLMPYENAPYQAYPIAPSTSIGSGRGRGSASASLMGSPSSAAGHLKLPGSGKRGRGGARASRAASVDPMSVPVSGVGPSLGLGLESVSAARQPSKMRETVSAQDEEMDLAPTVA